MTPRTYNARIDAPFSGGSAPAGLIAGADALPRPHARISSRRLPVSRSRPRRRTLAILRDSETERLLKDMVNPLVDCRRHAEGRGRRRHRQRSARSTRSPPAGSGSTSIPGLLNAADNANQVQGVMAHELGHIVGGHAIGIDNGFKQGQQDHAPLAAARRRGGAWRAPETRRWAAISLGQQAAYGSLLAFSRGRKQPPTRPALSTCPRPASPAAAARTSSASCRTSSSATAIRTTRRRPIASTHPLSGDRIATLREVYEKDPAWNAKPDPAARGALPARQGQALRLPRQARGHAAALSAIHDHRAGATMPGFTPITRTRGSTTPCAKPTPCWRRAERSLFPRDQGPGPARSGQARRCAGAPAPGDRADRTTTR